MKKDKWFQYSTRYQLSPFPNYFSMECITKEMKGVIGFGYKKIMLIFRGNEFWAYFKEKDSADVALKMFNKLKHDPNFFQMLIKRQKKFGPEFIKIIKTNARKNLKEASDKDLAKFHKQYEKYYKRTYSNYFPILAVEKYLTNYLFDYLLNKFKDQEIASNYFTQLISEPKGMVNQQEKIAALKLAIKIKNNKKWLSYFKKKNTENLVEKNESLTKLIKNHEKKWFWLTRDYENDILTFSDFVQRLKKHLKSDPKKELDALNQKIVELQQIIKNTKLDKGYCELFQAMRDGMHLKELRKSIVSQSLYYYDPILKEIARRGNITLRQARFLKTEEVEDMLADKKNYSKILTERLKLSAYVIGGNKKTKVLTGKRAEKIFNQLNTIPENIKEIKGMAVSHGKAKGPVRIVLGPSECKKVKRGDVIVTGQAVPSFSSAIAIASAIVADGGTGITSHPATLAREAGIPCVAGARIATKVLKDGQMVEVDGDSGVVRVI